MAKETFKRVTLDLGRKAVERIARLQSILDVRTMVQIIQQALQLFEFFVDRTLKGYQFLAKNPETGETEVIMILDLMPVRSEAEREADAPVYGN
jgi:hypothetical protein